jgi:hypothetical protein
MCIEDWGKLNFAIWSNHQSKLRLQTMIMVTVHQSKWDCRMLAALPELDFQSATQQLCCQDHIVICFHNHLTSSIRLKILFNRPFSGAAPGPQDEVIRVRITGYHSAIESCTVLKHARKKINGLTVRPLIRCAFRGFPAGGKVF